MPANVMLLFLQRILTNLHVSYSDKSCELLTEFSSLTGNSSLFYFASIKYFPLFVLNVIKLSFSFPLRSEIYFLLSFFVFLFLILGRSFYSTISTSQYHWEIDRDFFNFFERVSRQRVPCANKRRKVQRVVLPTGAVRISGLRYQRTHCSDT